MVLVREVEFETRGDLLALEREEIDKYIGGELCLNHNRPVITHAEKKEMDRVYGIHRRSEHKDAERDRVAEWRRNNPDKYALQVARSVEQQRQKRVTLL